jgi:hypothetical protein
VTTVEITPTIDSFLSGIGATQDVNFGTELYCVHRATYLGGLKLSWNRAIANFDLNVIDPKTINAASLHRYMFDIINPGGVQAVLMRCTRPDEWTELGVTSKKYDGVGSWVTFGGDVDEVGPPAKLTYTEATATGWHSITGLKPLVEDALANRAGILSIITRLNDENPLVNHQFAWRSREYGSNIWYLEVDYDPLEGGIEQRRATLQPIGAQRPRVPHRPSFGAPGARPRSPRRARTP